MFTGIVEELGRAESLQRRGSGWLLTVSCRRVLEGTRIGDSISVNGVCLTVVQIHAGGLSFDVMPETRDATTIGLLRCGTAVNLERSLKAGERVGGHFVSGHVDCRGVIRSRRIKAGNLCIEVGVPARLMRWIVPRGSVAVDGISLTVMETRGGAFSVYLIPHTAGQTTLGSKWASAQVNVEADMLVKSACQKG